MPSTITGDKFKQMLMHAGHTKGYISASAKQHLQKTTLHSGTKASSILHNAHAHVSKADATKIIKELKAKGLAHGIVGSAQEYVRKAFKHEEAKQAMIKKQNVNERAQEIAAEKAKETAATTAKNTKGTIKPTKPASAPVRLATDSVSAVASAPSGQSQRPTGPMMSAVSNMLTPKKSVTSTVATEAPSLNPKNSIPLTAAREEVIDMAID